MTSTVAGTYIGTNGIPPVCFQYQVCQYPVQGTDSIWGRDLRDTDSLCRYDSRIYAEQLCSLQRKTSLTSATSGVYVSTSGISTGNGSAWITMANGQLYGTGGGGTASTGYVSFNNYWTDDGVYGTRVAGEERECLSLLPGLVWAAIPALGQVQR